MTYNKKKTNITIQDIAKVLDISSSTVSRALNNNPRISNKTREKVWQIAKDLGYEPGVPGYYLPQSSYKNIGIIIPSLNSKFYTDIFKAVQKQLAEYNILITVTNNKIEQERIAIENYMELGVEGIFISLVSGEGDREYIADVIKKGIPVVNFDKVDFNLPLRRVIIDNYQGAYNATEHLLSMGCKKIALILGKEDCPVTSEIVNGNKTAIHKAGLAYRKEYILYTSLVKEEIDVAIDHLFSLQEVPDAILTVTSQAALQIIFKTSKKGVHIPNELCVVCFGNEVFNEFVSPALTAIESSGKELGKSIVNAFNQTIIEKREGIPNSGKTYIQPVNVIIRGSTMRM